MKDKANAVHEKTFKTGSRIIAGIVLGVILVAGVGGWAATAQLSGAVVSQGSVTVDQKLKSIQHRDGGIVSEIMVREGDFVRRGQVLIRLEDAQTKAELSIVKAQLHEHHMRKARLLAERDGLSKIEFPKHTDVGNIETTLIVSGETRLFEGNYTHRESQKKQLELSVEQIGEEIKGLTSQQISKDHEMTLLDTEHKKIKSLADKQLIETTRIYNSERDRARLLGEHGEIVAGIARAKNRMAEIRLQIIAIDEAARTEAQRELSLVEPKISELNERKMAIEDRLSRTDIRAPISGTVNELNIHTIGGVITPAEILITIVPEDAKLKVEVRLAPINIEQIFVGQPARLRFTAFNQRTTPELKGEIIHVSPATSSDPKTGETYYLGDVHVPLSELEKLGGQNLLPGMPVEVYVTTAERTALSYFVKPLTDQFNRAFKER